ncbi:hypothetical protein HPB48_009484 [Haemaphysalis longicornis]|uniref:Uncharacterized protein n=1 Tax=Haemaphysalis longicornis TaxID=44386 RepID=A0A9J6GF82_HAELO|nr:hypothetical protein HPB48_009484 [Haemaphysalis longicornis]
MLKNQRINVNEKTKTSATLPYGPRPHAKQGGPQDRSDAVRLLDASAAPIQNGGEASLPIAIAAPLPIASGAAPVDASSGLRHPEIQDPVRPPSELCTKLPTSADSETDTVAIHPSKRRKGVHAKPMDTQSAIEQVVSSKLEEKTERAMNDR